MAMDDLFQALNMFKSGVQQLQTSRVIQGANQQVADIKASEASDADKRNQLTSLSHQLVGQLGALGAPVSDIAQQAQNVMPQQFANANQMNTQALLGGDKNLAAQAKQQQDFEFDLDKKKALALAKADPMYQMRMMQMKSMQDERDQKHLEGLNKLVDVQTSRFGNISKLQGVNNQIQDAMTMINSPEVYRQNISELARKFDSILSQGSSTIAGTEHLEPNTLAQKTAAVKELLTSKPQNLKDDMQGFLNYYQHAFDRIKQVNQSIIQEGQKNNIQSVMRPIAKRNPDIVRGYIQDKLGLDADIDPRSGKISFKDPAQTGPASQPQMKTIMVRDKRTGAMVKALQGPDGQLYQAGE